MAKTHLLIGRNVLEEALSVKSKIIQIYFENAGAEAFARKLFTALRAPMPKFREGIPREVRELSHQGIAFDVEHDFYLDDRDCDWTDFKNILLCNHLEDVQNLGAIVRSAVAFGCDLIVHESRRSVQLTATAIKISAGQAFRMKFLEIGNLMTIVQQLKKDADFEIAVLEAPSESTMDLYRWTPHSRVALIVGSESEGVSKPLLNQADVQLSIPMKRGVESLNAAQSATVALGWLFHCLNGQDQTKKKSH